jgi:negative regulator of flagellin synthesis FlgM
MRFTEPKTFLLQAILLGLYKPSEPAAFVGPAVKRTGSSDKTTCEPRGGILRRLGTDQWFADRRRFDMQIYGSSQLHGAQGINAPHFNRTSAPAQSNTPASIDTTDELQLSPAAEMAGKMSDIPDIRWDRVNSIREQIANGTYMTDDKLDGALNRLLDEIA